MLVKTSVSFLYLNLNLQYEVGLRNLRNGIMNSLVLSRPVGFSITHALGLRRRMRRIVALAISSAVLRSRGAVVLAGL